MTVTLETTAPMTALPVTMAPMAVAPVAEVPVEEAPAEAVAALEAADSVAEVRDPLILWIRRKPVKAMMRPAVFVTWHPSSSRRMWAMTVSPLRI